MPRASIYERLLSAKKDGKKHFAVLVDPDKMRMGHLDLVLELAASGKVDYFFIGGSLIVNNMLDECLSQMKETCNVPLILFPGNSFQLSYRADAILFLSLISGRNAELLIGNHVIAAPYLRLSPLEILPTGYMLIDGGTMTTVLYMSNTKPIPAAKDDIAVCTAMAGEMLGLKLIFMDAGSGATRPISERMIEAVSGAIRVPLIVGGGIRTPEKALSTVAAGADVVVVGNAIEKDPNLLVEISEAIHSYNQSVNQ